MDDAPDAEPEDSPYLRLPWPVVAAGLVGLLAVALAIGLFANRYLRPQLDVLPTPAPIAAPRPHCGARSGCYADGRANPRAGTNAAHPGHRTSPDRHGACSDSRTHAPPAPRPTTSATPRATVIPELAAEIGDAYQAYWQVRAAALYDLDTSRLPAVMAGEHLAAVEDRINELRSEGHAFETDVDHHYVVFEASAQEAKVADSYVDHSVYVDLQTHARVTTATDEKLNEVYVMNNTDGNLEGW